MSRFSFKGRINATLGAAMFLLVQCAAPVNAATVVRPSTSLTVPAGTTTTISAGTFRALNKVMVAPGGNLVVNLGKTARFTDTLPALINYGTISFISSSTTPSSVFLSTRFFNNGAGGTINGGALSNLQIQTPRLINNGIIQDNVSLSISSARSLVITGGVLDAPIINLIAPHGYITATLASATGVVNTNALAANVGVQTGTLNLGTVITRGDPTYFNDTGNINIAGNINVAGNLAILAAGNITVMPTVSSIIAHNITGNGYGIALVAGAAMSVTGTTTSIGTTPPITGNATAAVSLTGLPSGTGGNVDLTGSPSLQISSTTTCTKCSNSGIMMAAFANGAGTGQILLANPSPSDTGTVVTATGPASGTSGNITLIAGATSGNAISSGTLNAGGRTLRLVTAQPTTSDGLPLVFATDGSISSGNRLIPSATLGASSINITGDLKSADTIAITAGKDVVTSSYVSGSITSSAGTYYSAVSPSGKRLYVPSPTDGNVLVIDTATNQVVATIATGGSQAVGALVSPNGTRLYVTDPADNEVFVINTSTNKVVSTIQGVTDATSLAISADGKQLFVTQPSADSIAQIDTTTRVVTPVPLGVGVTPGPIALNRSSGVVYIGEPSAMGIYDPALGTTTQVGLAFTPGGFGACPCGTKIFLTDIVGGKAYAFSTETNSIMPFSITVGSSPQGVGINPTGSTAYVANSGAGTLSVVSTLSNTVSQTLPTGPGTPIDVAATFVGNNPVQFISDSTGHITVVKTPVLSSKTTNIFASTGDVTAFTGPTTVSAYGPGFVQITSPGNLVLSGAGKPGPTPPPINGYQLATLKNITVNASLDAGLVDFHAINGTLVNNGTMTTSGPLLFIASDKVINKGFIGTRAGALGPVSFQAPSGVLNISLTAGSLISSAIGVSQRILLNPAGGMVTTVKGQGALTGGGLNVRVIGSDYQKVTIDVTELNNGVEVMGHFVSSLKVTTHSRDLLIGGNIHTDGGSVTAEAKGGAIILTGALDTSSGAPGVAGGNITLTAQSGVTASGVIDASGLGGARGGNITINAKTARFVADIPAELNSTGSGGMPGGAVKIVSGGSISILSGSSTAGSFSLRSTAACCQSITVDGALTATDGNVDMKASGGISVYDPIQAAKAITATAAHGSISVVGDMTTTNGSITLKSGGPSIYIRGVNVTANSNTSVKANVLIQNTNTIDGTITIDKSNIATSGVGGGNISVSIGAPSAKVGIVPQGVSYSPTPGATGPFFFGTNGIDVVNAANISMTSTNGGRIIFNTGARPSSAITIDASAGSVSLTAVGFGEHADETDIVVDAADDD